MGKLYHLLMYHFQGLLILLEAENLEVTGNEEGSEDVADLFNLSCAAFPESQLRRISSKCFPTQHHLTRGAATIALLNGL